MFWLVGMAIAVFWFVHRCLFCCCCCCCRCRHRSTAQHGIRQSRVIEWNMRKFLVSNHRQIIVLWKPIRSFKRYEKTNPQQWEEEREGEIVSCTNDWMNGESVWIFLLHFTFWCIPVQIWIAFDPTTIHTFKTTYSYFIPNWGFVLCKKQFFWFKNGERKSAHWLKVREISRKNSISRKKCLKS